MVWLKAEKPLVESNIGARGRPVSIVIFSGKEVVLAHNGSNRSHEDVVVRDIYYAIVIVARIATIAVAVSICISLAGIQLRMAIVHRVGHSITIGISSNRTACQAEIRRADQTQPERTSN